MRRGIGDIVWLFVVLIVRDKGNSMSAVFEIDITRKIAEFRRVFETNERMVFSASFGSGKSYFMDKFKQTFQSEYYFFTLYPVNYVISPNESIMEYIKRDIVFQLVDHGLVLDKWDWQSFLRDIAKTLDISDLVSFLSQIPDISSWFKQHGTKGFNIKPAKLVFENHYSSKKYLDSFSNSGSIYENDAYTCFIRKSFEILRKLDSKRIVLIIEDMDRIDPAHLFTILNVFGAHIDRHYVRQSEVDHNKFGFDKMVIMMDYKSVSGMFHHRYGKEADFSGYMGKFLSSSPYFYSIYLEARSLVLEKLLIYSGVRDRKDPGVREIIQESLQGRSLRSLKRIYEFNPATVIRDSLYVQVNGLKLARNHLLVLQNAYRCYFGIEFYGATQEYKNYPRLLAEAQMKIPYALLKYGLYKSLVCDGKKYSIVTDMDDDGIIRSFSIKRTKELEEPVLTLEYFDSDFMLMEIFDAFNPYYL